MACLIRDDEAAQIVQQAVTLGVGPRITTNRYHHSMVKRIENVPVVEHMKQEPL